MFMKSALLVAVIVCSIQSGCTCQEEPSVRSAKPAATPEAVASAPERAASEPGSGSNEVLVFNFSGPRPQPSVTLWPAAPGLPASVHQLEQRAEDDALRITVSDEDPWMLWRFATPVAASLLVADVELDRAGSLQAFWADAACPELSEACSTELMAAPGRHRIEFLIGTGQPVAQVRFDLPGVKGTKATLYSLRLYAEPVVQGRFEGRSGHTTVAPSPNGLLVSSTEVDPWVVFDLPAFSADRAARIEIELEAPPSTTPWVFWEGATCTEFDQRCSASLDRLDDRRFGAKLAGHGQWTGRVTRLRLDPGDDAGRYVLRRFALMR